MIEVASEAGIAVITICNYDRYQDIRQEREASDEAPRKADARQAQGTEQQDNQLTSNIPSVAKATSGSARKGCRLPIDWMPDPLPDSMNWREWDDGSIVRELSKFRDWAASAPGSKGVKQDWNAAWRNWLRRAEQDGNLGKQASGKLDNGRLGGSVTERAMQRAAQRLGIEGPGFGGQAGTAKPISDHGRAGGVPDARRPLGDDRGGQGQLAYRGRDGGG